MKTVFALLIFSCAFWINIPSASAQSRTDELLERAGGLVEQFWEQIPSYNCKELVTREKLEKKGKVDYRQRLEFDYIALTKAQAQHLTVEELRVPLKSDIAKPDMPSLLETNGFPTLLLIFHPRYQANYRFQMEEDGPDDGRPARIHFEHIHGAGSTSAVMVQGKAYALELQGTAWINSGSGAIQKISASLMGPMKDINVEDFSAEVTYELQNFPFENESRWLPSKAMIELQTKLQRWRNTHLYSQYRRFVVETTEAMEK